MTKNLYDVLVVGAGPVGLYASYLAKEKGLNVKIIEATNEIGGQPLLLFPNKQVHDYPSYSQVLSFDLIDKLRSANKALDVKVDKNEELLEFTKENDLFRCKTSKSEFSAKSIILALGNGFVTPNKLEIIGADNINITYKVSSNYHDYDNKDVVILGGGDSAVDFANDLKTKSSANVTIIHRRDVFRANGENVKKLEKNNVHIILNANLEKIKDNNLYFENKKDNSKQKVHFDTIIVQYGQKINTQLPSCYKNVKHNEFGKFIVDRYQQTNIENVYAVGNCCFYPNRGNLIVIGHGEAAVAVLDILRKLKKYEEHKIA